MVVYLEGAAGVETYEEEGVRGLGSIGSGKRWIQLSVRKGAFLRVCVVSASLKR